MGYEYWPQGLEASIRFAAETAQTPLYVTENGIGTTDDALRVRYTTDALEGVGRCLADGLDVRGYFHWSLMDNFEWAQGYLPMLRPRGRRPGDPAPHAEALGRLAGRRGQGEPTGLNLLVALAARRDTRLAAARRS